MVYIRVKKIRKDRYLYLVKSVWDPERGTARQKIVKYLGNAKNVTLSDIPAEYADDPRILRLVSESIDESRKDSKTVAEGLAESLHRALTDGNLRGALEILKSHYRIGSTADFFEDMLRPVMYRIGAEWAEGMIDISTEHLASNTARDLVATVQSRTAQAGGKSKVLLCSPSGEEHCLGCNVICTFLQSHGFHVFNLSPSVPAETVLQFIQREEPDVVMVSVTTEDGIPATRRLVGKIRERHTVPVMIGGQAVQAGSHWPGAEVVGSASIMDIPGMIRQLVK